MNILFGADPEAVAVYEKAGEKFAVPPCYFRKNYGVPASDHPKHPVFLKTKEWTLHEDGAAFEFSVKPSYNPLELFQTIQEAAKSASERILVNYPQECLPTLQFLPTVNWEVERWLPLGKEFADLTKFGCDPDEDIYDTYVPEREEDASLHPYRYCGGHIHISGNPMIADDPHAAIACMVITAGLASIAYSDMPEKESLRLYRYGKPGKMRVQVYGSENPYGPDYAVGVEYRTPSARWASNWNIAEKVLGWARIAMENLLDTGLGLKLHAEIEEEAKKAILTTNQALAMELLSYVESKI